MRLSFRLCLGIPLLFGLAACTKDQQLDPEQTRLGPTRPDRIDFNTDDPQPLVNDAFSEDLLAEGLSPRTFLDGDQIRGLYPTIYFDFDQSFIRPADRPALDEVAASLRSNPSDSLLVEGYCDWKGTAEYNLALGDRRATSVKTYLVNLGIDPTRIEILSKGDLEADTSADAAGRALDRKAELVVVRP